MREKRITKTFCSVVITFLLLMVLLPMKNVSAASSNIASGSGWYLDSAGCLHITGSVSNSSFGADDQTPWKNYKTQIISVVAEKGASIENATNLFSNCTNLTSVDIHLLNTSNVTWMTWMFYNCKSLKTLDLSGLDTAKSRNMSDMFRGCTSLETLNLSGLDTSNVEHFVGTFWDCTNLKSLNLSGFNTAKVTEMDWMFMNCSSLESLDLRNFNTSNVKTMGQMFSGCTKLSYLNISSFNTQNVTTMYRMFERCFELTSLDVSKFNTAKVYNMEEMFSGCEKLTTLDVSNFDTSNVETMKKMFSSCQSLKNVDISRFKTSNLKNIEMMFWYCLSINKLDFSSFDCSNIENCNNALKNCSKLNEISVNPSFANLTADQLLSICPNWSSKGYHNVYSSAADLKASKRTQTLVKGKSYNIYIGNMPVTDMNKKDVLGDGGSVQFYLYEDARPEAYGTGEKLVLNNMQLTKGYWSTDNEGNKALLYIDRDTSICLIGNNTINVTWEDDLDGMYVAMQNYVSIWGDGTLDIKVSNNGGRAIAAPGCTLSLYENAKLKLAGHYGYYSDYSGDMGYLELYENSKVYAYGYRADDDTEGLAIDCPDVSVEDSAYLYAEYDWNQPAVNTWGYSFSSYTRLKIRGIKDVPGIVNHTWSDVDSLTDESGKSLEYMYRALEIQALDVGGIITGTLTSYGDERTPIYVTFKKKSDSSIVYQTTLYGNSIEFCFDQLPSSFYIMTVTKANHETYTADVYLNVKDKTIDIELVQNIDTSLNGVIYSDADDKFYLYEDGQIQWDYNGIAYSEYDDNFWVITNGAVDFGFQGVIYSHYDQKFYATSGGRVDFNYTGVIYSSYDGKFYYAESGVVLLDYDGAAYSPYDDSFYAVHSGTVDFSFTGLIYSQYDGNFYVAVDGKVDLNYNGMAYSPYDDSFYAVENGTVNFNYNGLLLSPYDGNYYDVVGGKVVF